MAGQKQNSMRMSYEYKGGPDMKEKIDAAKAAIEEATKGIEGFSLKCSVEVGQGAQYMTITGI
jgi:hypothetical protein